MSRDEAYLLDIVWDVIEHHLPRLIAQIEPLVPPDTEAH
jgi:uncharacterized protein with HEPN domain